MLLDPKALPDPPGWILGKNEITKMSTSREVTTLFVLDICGPKTNVKPQNVLFSKGYDHEQLRRDLRVIGGIIILFCHTNEKMDRDNSPPPHPPPRFPPKPGRKGRKPNPVIHPGPTKNLDVFYMQPLIA